MLHKDFRRNGLTTKDFQPFNLEKPARFGSHQKSVYQGHSCSTISFFLHWRCSLALQTAATWSSRSKETIIQPTPHDFIYRAPKGRFPILIVHSLVFLPSSSTWFWWLLILSLTAQYPSANCCHLYCTLTADTNLSQFHPAWEYSARCLNSQ